MAAEIKRAKNLLSVYNVIHVQSLESLQDRGSVELGLFDFESLFGSKQHVKLASRAVVHANGCVGFASHRKLLLHQELRKGFCPRGMLRKLLFALNPFPLMEGVAFCLDASCGILSHSPLCLLAVLVCIFLCCFENTLFFFNDSLFESFSFVEHILSKRYDLSARDLCSQASQVRRAF